MPTISITIAANSGVPFQSPRLVDALVLLQCSSAFNLSISDAPTQFTIPAAVYVEVALQAGSPMNIYNTNSSAITISLAWSYVDISSRPLIHLVEAGTINVLSSGTVDISSGTVDANVTNASIPVSGSVDATIQNASIAVTGTITADLASGSTVDIGNTPAVTINSGTVDIGNAISIAASQTVNIGTAPAIDIASGQTVGIVAGSASIGSIDINSGQTVGIAAGTAVIGSVTVASGSIDIGNTPAVTVNSGSIQATFPSAQEIVIETDSVGLSKASQLPTLLSAGGNLDVNINEEFIFGDGSDGAVDFNGTKTFSFAALVSSTYTLNRDVQASTIKVESGITVNTANFRMFGESSIAVLLGGIVIANGLGGAGGAGVGQNTAGLAGNQLASAFGFLLGGGGGSGGTDTGSVTSGAGGAGGGLVWLSSPLILNSGSISANGLAGLQGGVGSCGGGGGGGGTVVIIYKLFKELGAITTAGGAGGAPNGGSTTAHAGGAGAAGYGGGGGGGVDNTGSAGAAGDSAGGGGGGGTSTSSTFAGGAGGAGSTIVIAAT